MAGAILDTIRRKLSSLIPKSSSSSSSKVPPEADHEELQKLQETLMRIQSVLHDADTEEKDIIDKSEQLRLSELKEIAYDAEDVMDDYKYEALRDEVEVRRRTREAQVFDHQSSTHPSRNSNIPELTSRVREIRQRFETITDEWSRICLQERSGKMRRRTKEMEWKPVETTSFLDGVPILGRKDERDEIIGWLLQQGGVDENTISVLSIIGMGGVGKTAIAQVVYNDPRVSQHFDLRAWTCVSEDFDVVNLTKRIILSLTNSRGNRHAHMNLDSMSLDELYRTLKRALNGCKFLLVLDDVWNQKLRLWHSLRSALVGVGVGKIIVTTRNESVARIMQAAKPIYLTSLSFDDCWSLFLNIAFRVRDRTMMHHNLLDIGKKMVEKCQGLPLAVKVLASILSIEDEEEEWVDILGHELWELEDENNDILPALKLSYDRMPRELRPCFMYLSLFPKNSKLERRSIVQQWMSHSFITCEKGKRTKQEEDIGNAYFDELLHRSLLQKSNSWQGEEFTMHDLIHDLAQSVAKDEYALITRNKMFPISKTIRHVSAYVGDDSDIAHLKALFESNNLRTLFLQYVEECPLVESLHNLTCLRVLICEGLNKKATKLPDAIGNLKHLRYLGINSFESVPESLYELYHLQTLHLMFPNGATNFCRGIGNLINLRHLREFTVNLAGSHMHGEVGWLTNLRTLKFFKVGDESWACKVRQLKDLINLGGYLRVVGLETVELSDFTPGETYLKATGGVTRLTLVWNHRKVEKKGAVDERLAEQLLICLRPHPNVVHLSIDGYPAAILPSWLGDAGYLSKLQQLSLCNCKCISLPTLGQLPALRTLVIQALKGIKSVGRDLQLISSSNIAATSSNEEDVGRSCCFPSLEKLLFLSMDAWEEWNDGADSAADFPRLDSLQLWFCPKLRTLPFLRELTRLLFVKYYNVEVLSCCNLPRLRSLQIRSYRGDTLIFPNNECIRSLKKLQITRCRELRSVEGLGNLPSLAHLEIKECPILRISPDVHLNPGLQPQDHVTMEGSPEVEKWYRDQFSGA